MKPKHKRLTAVIMAAMMVAPACSLSSFAADVPAPDTIVCEDMNQRDANTKVFQKENGTYVALASASPVHYQKDGYWAEIDNTLEKKKDAAGGTVYSNKNNAYTVTLPERMGGGQPVILSHQGYTLSFTFDQSQDVSKKIDIHTQKAAPGATDAERRAGFEKRSSSVTYENIDRYTDLQYIISPTRLTENIILERAPQSAPAYRFFIQAEGLTPCMNEDRSIDFQDAAGKAVFTIPAPYMYDDANARSEDVQSQLEAAADGGYVLTYLPSLSWLQSEDRQYPIIVDPDILIKNTASNSFMSDTYVDSGKPDTNFDSSDVISISNMDGQEQSIYCDPRQAALFLSKKNVVSTELRYHQAGYYRFSDKAAAGIYEIYKDWNSHDVTYNTRPTIAPFPFDTSKLKGDTLEFDLTKQFILLSKMNFIPESLTQPSSSPFYGFAIQVLDADTKGISWYDAADTPYADYGPVLEIAFTNQSGSSLSENSRHWDLGPAGRVTLNEYTGFVSIERDEIGVADARMPVQIKRHFDSAYGTFSIQNEFGMLSPYGGYWQTNYNRILSLSPAGVMGVDVPISTPAPTYQYLDGDGTIYDFAYSGPSTNGFDLWLPAETAEPASKDLVLYIPQNMSATMDYSQAYLLENGTLRINFNTAGQMNRMTDLQNEEAAIQLTYLPTESDNNNIFPHQQIDRIIDSEGRIYRFNYNANERLGSIDCLNADGTPYLMQTADGQNVPYTVAYGYNADYGACGLITTTAYDGALIEYETASNLLDYFPSVIGNPDTGTALGLSYERSDFRVNHVEYYENNTLAEKYDILMSDLNQVVFVYGDEDYLLKQYNRQGQLISVFDEQGKMLCLRGSDGVMHNVPGAVPFEDSFENGLTGGAWSAAGLVMSTGDQARTGSKSIMMINSGSIFKQNAKSYDSGTVSAYIKTPTASADIGAKLTVSGYDAVGNTVYCQSSTTVGGTNGQWSEAKLDFELPSATVEIKLAIETAGSGILYVDDFTCRERGMVIDSENNLIRNPDFATELNPDTDWAVPPETETGRSELDEYMASFRLPGLGLDKFVGDVGGNIHYKNSLSQTVTINGKAGESFCYGAWTGAFSAVQKEGCSYSMRIEKLKPDGSTQLLSEYAFNPYVLYWQYGGDFFTLEEDVDQVIVSLNYDHQTSAAQFDGVHLNRVTL